MGNFPLPLKAPQQSRDIIQHKSRKQKIPAILSLNEPGIRPGHTFPGLEQNPAVPGLDPIPGSGSDPVWTGGILNEVLSRCFHQKQKQEGKRKLILGFRRESDQRVTVPTNPSRWRQFQPIRSQFSFSRVIQEAAPLPKNPMNRFIRLL